MHAQSLVAVDVVKFFGDRKVLDGVHLAAHPGQRLGLVGENGAGKSTLLRLLAGADTPDAGQITRPEQIGLLHQELPFAASQTVGDVLAEALAESRELLARLDSLLRQPSRLDEYADILQRAEQAQAWDAEWRAQEILHGLGLGAIGYDRTLGTLSGGQRSRVALAALLVRRPAALFLDEPTNHLDDQAIAFLEGELRRLPGVVVVASHDRVFLDEVCTAILDLDPARDGVTRYGGAYTAYLAAKQAERVRWEQAFAGRQDEMNALRLAIKTTARQVAHHRPPRDGNKMSYDAHGEKVQASISSRVRNAAQRLEMLERSPIRKPPPVLHFQAPALTTVDGAGTAHLVSLREVDVPGRVRVAHLDIASGDRLLVTGPNGCGKSSLLAVIHSGLPGLKGAVLRRRGLKTGLLAQDDHWPDPARTPRDLYGERDVPLADLGLLAPRDLDRPLAHLSVGQRRRLALALLIADPPHLLLLDEPSNHLSLTLADELENALRSAPGAVVIASHDRWLCRRWEYPQLDLQRR